MSRPNGIIISHFQARPLLQARRDGWRKAAMSLDLGLSQVEVALDDEGVLLPGGRRLAWPEIERIAGDENACFTVEDGRPEKVQFYSEEFGRAYSLMPTAGAPTMLISGVPMHRIKGIEPHEDTLRKMRAVVPVRGRVLDTATGLGYTAIEAAKEADEVVTIELDPAALAVARLNPWSRALFDNPKIRQLTGDAFELVQTFADGSFDCVIHDPPVVSLAGELYSGAFYAQLLRVLRPGGRLFHYVGDPESRSGAGTTRGVIRRLQEAGFREIVRRPEAFGVVARR